MGFSISCIQFCLCIPKLRIFSFRLCQKLFMASLLDHFPFMEDQYLIAKPAGRKSVDDIDRGPVSHDLIEL